MSSEERIAAIRDRYSEDRYQAMVATGRVDRDGFYHATDGRIAFVKPIREWTDYDVSNNVDSHTINAIYDIAQNDPNGWHLICDNLLRGTRNYSASGAQTTHFIQLVSDRLGRGLPQYAVASNDQHAEVVPATASVTGAAPVQATTGTDQVTVQKQSFEGGIDVSRLLQELNLRAPTQNGSDLTSAALQLIGRRPVASATVPI